MKNINNVEYWEYFTNFIADEFDSGVFDLIIKPNNFVSFRNGVLTLISPSKTVQKLINEQFRNKLEAFILADSGNKVIINAVLSDEQNYEKQKIENISSRDFGFVEKVVQTQKNTFVIDNMVLKFTNIHKPDSKMIFDMFMVGQSNQMAYEGAKQFCNDSSKYNTLFFFGDSGVGKSHLVNAIGNYFKKLNQKVAYMGAHKFTEIYTSSLGHITTDDLGVGSIDEFTRILSQLDVLIIDDIQWFTGKTGSNDTFFNVFEHLNRNGKKIVITADTPPKFLKGIPDRLKTRFSKSLQTQIFKPEVELSKKYLKRELENIWSDIPDMVITNEVYEVLALNYGTDFRNLDGVLQKLDFIVTTNPTNVISMDYVSKHILGSRVEKTKIKGVEIQKIVSEKFMIETSLLIGKSRKKDVKDARHVAIYLYRKRLDHSYKEIGSVFGGRDHSTIIHSEKSVKERMMKDNDYRLFVDGIEKLVFG